jgi:undecaprenyl phosphate-alpha-L-ara4N flippase subunit ArnE
MNIFPWLILSLVVGLSTIGQLSLKYAFELPKLTAPVNSSMRELWRSPYFWIWFGCYTIGAGLWLLVLRFIPLSQAFPALGITFALIPLGSYYLLGERVVFSQWWGIATIVAGVILVVQT